MNGINLGGMSNLGQNNTPTQIGGLNLKKGMSLDLGKYSTLEEVEVGLGWIENSRAKRNSNEFDLDATALILQSNGRVKDSYDVIYYNQPDTNRGVMSEGDNRIGNSSLGTDCEKINVTLNRVPDYADSIKIIVTIHEADKRRQNFGMVDNAYIACRNKETGEELCRYQLSSDFAMNTAVEMGELRRTNKGWEFIALGNGSQKDLYGILISHGVQ